MSTAPESRTDPGEVDRGQVPAPRELRPFRFPEITRSRLSSQLPVYCALTGGFPIVTLGLMIPSGGVHEEADRAGLASLTGALLESGAGARNAAQIAEALDMLGMRLDVATSWDVSHVQLTGLRSQIAAAVDILADLIRHPTFPESEVARIRDEHLGAILQRRADPRSLANEMAARFIFSDESPFARPLTGTSKTLAGLTRSDVLDWHASTYTPFGGAIVVAGEIDPDDAHDLANRAFGDWVGPASEPVLGRTDPRSDDRQVIVVDRPGSVQAEIRVGRVGVSRMTPDYFPLVVMNTILGGAFSSRLNLNLRERNGYTYGASSRFSMRRQPGTFLVSSAVQTEVTAAALGEILKELTEIRNAPPSPSEIEDARNYVAGVFPLRLQTTQGVAAHLTELALYQLPLGYFDEYAERILAVDADEVLRVAREYLAPDGMAIVITGDAEQIRAPLEAMDLGPVTVVDPEELE